MTVFNAFLKVIRKNSGTILLYIAIVLIFSFANAETGDSIGTFTGEKPPVCITDLDGSALSENFVKYVDEKTQIKDIPENNMDDALFYREISCIIIIPENYGAEVMAGKEPEIEIRSTASPETEFVKIILQRYIRIQKAYVNNSYTEREILIMLEKAMKSSVSVEIVSKLNTSELSKMTSYFNFAAYSMMSCIVFIICLVLSSFNDEMIKKRTIISSISHTKYSRDLLLSSCAYAAAVWIFFIIAGIVIVGKSVITFRGLLYMINALLFSLTSLSLAYMLSTVLKEKNAVTGIVNVITLGCSFLCGVFVPMEFLPENVTAAAHILPTYWYVDTNNRLKEIEDITVSSIVPIMINYSVLFGIFVLFFVIGLIVSSKKRKIA